MGEPSRREKIEAMLAEDPQDCFLQYSLALELQKEDRCDQSLQYFQRLMDHSPPYVPAFLMAGQLLVQLQQIHHARQVLRTGIEAARQQGETHAAGEMSELLAQLGSLGE
ncbi:MAG: hypothetical protein GTO53_11465 [Planctomycetales bacterium]|nr:hypothetical protein [Planctomycetales bacterium]NIM09731.1 hypothetical protein [Planctomycetales bacterium]NIN09206.1 hypothetical protein [Planctomycetales bacterium]NIN78303.1 hypothetical protein [Planctomycetales bacterium]NIO35317.1 hypothetical protein [Planctomycetales bacterium]